MFLQEITCSIVQYEWIRMLLGGFAVVMFVTVVQNVFWR